MTDEEGQESPSTHTGGGASIHGDIHTGGGTFIGRDQIIIHGQATTPEELTRELEFRFLKLRNVSLSLGSLLLEKSSPKVVGSDSARLRKHLAGKGGGSKVLEGESTEFLLSAFSSKLTTLQFPQAFLELPAHQSMFQKLKSDYSVDLQDVRFPGFPFQIFDNVDLVLRWIEVKCEIARVIPVHVEGAKVLSSFSDACLEAFAFCKALGIAFETYHGWQVQE